MAYIYIDQDGDECVKFERGKWDSVMGYRCPNCRTSIGDPMAAHDHENQLPCAQDPEAWRKVIFTTRGV